MRKLFPESSWLVDCCYPVMQSALLTETTHKMIHAKAEPKPKFFNEHKPLTIPNWKSSLFQKTNRNQIQLQKTMQKRGTLAKSRQNLPNLTNSDTLFSRRKVELQHSSYSTTRISSSVSTLNAWPWLWATPFRNSSSRHRRRSIACMMSCWRCSVLNVAFNEMSVIQTCWEIHGYVDFSPNSPTS